MAVLIDAPTVTGDQASPAPEPPRRRRGWLGAVLVPLSGALVTLAIYAATLLVQRVHPFGTNSVLRHDLTGQYAPMFSYLRQAALGPEGFMFSWQGDLGMNFLPVFAYYLASPVNLIALAVQDSQLPEAVIAIIATKLALAAAMMAIYLRRTFPGPAPLVVAAAATYATSSWVIFHTSNIMWLDALYLLPLVLLAIERLLARRSIWPLAAATAATMTVNYYAGFMAMLFAGCYLLVRYVATATSDSLKELVATAIKAATAVAAGVATAGILIIPSLRSLENRYASPVNDVSKNVPLGWDELVGSLFGGTMLDQRIVGSHLAVGTVTLVLALVFFATGAIKLRERAGFAALAAFLVASCQIPALYLLWHGFDAPNSFPHRFGFVLTFLVVMLGYRAAATARTKVTATAAVIAAATAGTAAVWVAGERPDLMTERVLTWTIALVTAGAIAALFRRKALVVALAVVIVVDAAGAAMLASTTLVRTDRELWERPGPAWGAQLQAWNPSQNEFYRADALAWRTANDSLRFGNFAMTHYSSSTDGRAHRVFHTLGFSDANPYVRFDYQGSTPLTDALLGFRFVLSDRELHRPGYQLVKHVERQRPWPYQEPMYAYENTNALPVGFFLDPGNPITPDIKSPLTHLENLVGDKRLFRDVCKQHPTATGGTVKVRPDSAVLTRDPNVKSASLRWTCKATGDQLLVAWHEGKPNVSDIRLDKGTPITYPTAYATGPLDLGRREDETFTVEISTRAKTLAVPRPIVQGLDIARFQNLVDVLKKRTAKNVHWTSESLSLDVDDAKGGNFFLSVPHIPGWQAQVDGEPAAIETTAGAFIGFDLTPGKHRIELTFRPPGFEEGRRATAAGLVAIALLVLGSVVLSVLRRRRRSVPEPTASPSGG